MKNSVSHERLLTLAAATFLALTACERAQEKETAAGATPRNVKPKSKASESPEPVVPVSPKRETSSEATPGATATLTPMDVAPDTTKPLTDRQTTETQSAESPVTASAATVVQTPMPTPPRVGNSTITSGTTELRETLRYLDLTNPSIPAEKAVEIRAKAKEVAARIEADATLADSWKGVALDSVEQFAYYIDMASKATTPAQYQGLIRKAQQELINAESARGQ